MLKWKLNRNPLIAGGAGKRTFWRDFKLNVKKLVAHSSSFLGGTGDKSEFVFVGSAAVTSGGVFLNLFVLGTLVLRPGSRSKTLRWTRVDGQVFPRAPIVILGEEG